MYPRSQLASTQGIEIRSNSFEENDENLCSVQTQHRRLGAMSGTFHTRFLTLLLYYLLFGFRENAWKRLSDSEIRRRIFPFIMHMFPYFLAIDNAFSSVYIVDFVCA